MAPSAYRSSWQRIYRQTLTLIYKNLLIFYKTPISTIGRALVFPIVFTVIMCELRNITRGAPAISAGIASSSTPIQDLDVALKAGGRSDRLVFVRNGMYLELCGNGLVQRIDH
jgi:ATP-binding cassette subfamily A (ABC1) protein 3